MTPGRFPAGQVTTRRPPMSSPKSRPVKRGKPIVIRRRNSGALLVAGLVALIGAPVISLVCAVATKNPRYILLAGIGPLPGRARAAGRVFNPPPNPRPGA